MENTKHVLNEIKSINNAYDLPVEPIDNIFAEIPNAKVCTPIIGKFSSGKSALVNTMLGYSKRLLKEDITPETAVPAELIYTADTDNVRIYKNDYSCEDISVEEYRNTELDANAIGRVRISLRNNFLEGIPDVMIVDMPGFESGFEIHNRAIDEYLPQSLAYIVTFPADDLIVRSSVGNILKELMLRDMPICIVITKYDKRNDEFEALLEKLKENLRRFIGEREVHFCYTSSFDGNADEVREFLAQIQEESQSILARKFKKDVLSVLNSTEAYLKKILTSSEMTESELDEEEERLGKQLAGLNDKFSREKDDFDIQIAEAVEEIKSDVERALETEESTFVTMAMNNQSINERINIVVRNAVTQSVQKRLVPKVEKYLRRVEKCINGVGIGDVHVSFAFDAKEISEDLTGPVVAVVAGLVLGLPILGAIIAGIAYFMGKSFAEKKREEQKDEIRLKLHNEVYPQIMREVGNGVEMTVTKQMDLINTSIEEEIQNQKATLEKAVSDVRDRIADEKEKKENFTKGINNDLTRIAELREMIS